MLGIVKAWDDFPLPVRNVLRRVLSGFALPVSLSNSGKAW